MNNLTVNLTNSFVTTLKTHPQTRDIAQLKSLTLLEIRSSEVWDRFLRAVKHTQIKEIYLPNRVIGNHQEDILKLGSILKKHAKEGERSGVFPSRQEISEDTSDTDSEEAFNYEYSDLTQDEVPADDEAVIPHFRGEHFYKPGFSRKERREARKPLPNTGLHSAASYELAQVNWKDQQEIKAKEAALKQASQAVSTSIARLKQTGPVTACLARSTPSRPQYDSRLDEFVQSYVNSYATCSADMEKAPTQKLDNRSTAKTRAKWNLLKSLGYTKFPMISTSEDPQWALQYALALIHWSKTEHTLITSNSAAIPLGPDYKANGRPRFPYLGVLYTTLHTKEELDKTTSVRILELFTENRIDAKCASPGGHARSGFIRARERAFAGSIDAANIASRIIVRVPNFQYPYRSFYEQKYGMTKSQYDTFKSELLRFGPAENGALRNPNNYHRTQHRIVEFVMSSIGKQRLSLLREKHSIHFLDEKGELKPNPTDLQKFIDNSD